MGCGKAGCEGLCLSPEKPPPAPSNGAASSSSGSNASSSSSSATSEHILTNERPPRKGAFRWTRGELLGEGAYGKVINAVFEYYASRSYIIADVESE